MAAGPVFGLRVGLFTINLADVNENADVLLVDIGIFIDGRHLEAHRRRFAVTLRGTCRALGRIFVEGPVRTPLPHWKCGRVASS